MPTDGASLQPAPRGSSPRQRHLDCPQRLGAPPALRASAPVRPGPALGSSLAAFPSYNRLLPAHCPTWAHAPGMCGSPSASRAGQPRPWPLLASRFRFHPSSRGVTTKNRLQTFPRGPSENRCPRDQAQGPFPGAVSLRLSSLTLKSRVLIL